MDRPVRLARPGRESGISLVEIPVALVVLGIVLVIAGRTFSTAGHVQADSRSADQAMAFASAKLTEMEAQPLPGLADGEDQVRAPDGSVYLRKWTVTRPVAGSEARSVRMEVSWPTGKRKDRILVATLLR
jgi:type II secretory pathway pseudopilin PulG